MYQLLFVIHGAGEGARPVGDPPWWTDVIDGLRQNADTYGHGADLVLHSPQAGQVLVVPLTYHDVFDSVRQRWQQTDPDEAGWLPLLQQLAFNDPDVAARLPSWVQTCGTLFWTNVLDVLLYRLIAEYTVPVRLQVAQQIAEPWARADDENDASTPVHFLAHSLGTAVLHDAISELGEMPAFGIGGRQITSTLTCANVSWALENGFPAYTSIDRPIQNGGLTAASLSFRHELDPIAEVVKTFRGDEHGWSPRGYADRVLVEVKDWDVHAFGHYLDNPEVHLPLFERLWMTEAWRARRDDAMLRYRLQPGRRCPAAIAQARHDLAAVFSKPVSSSAEGFLDVMARTYGVFTHARAACGQEVGQ